MTSTVNPVKDILRSFPVMILDGALATELERHGCNLDDPLWSARVLIENPELIYQVHLDYFRAGADCALTASYQASIDGFAKSGIQKKEALALIKKTVDLAKKARDDYWKESKDEARPKPVVAASVGPYGAYLADGSEYIGHYTVSDEELEDFHRLRLAALIEAGADLIAFETIPSLREAKVLAALLEEHPKTTAWLSFSLKNETAISDGTSLEECAKTFGQNDQIAAIGLNCAPASVVKEAVKLLHKTTDKPIIVYPNSGETYNPETKTWHGEDVCGGLELPAKDWHEAGARLIGGCCRTSPHHIKEVAKSFRG
ncbi:homocysteine S-methyltransferase [Jeotgalibacillus sp. S-D1]|uniref:homocysteine S-methyltransferase n=1 Tax=Jeotgalibacillus sp. S-D1 TaxID=2552189 RepID=UPI00105A7535|nr:homocysteine S-methyltransferase [Jeotgalibacillus sp. S-D1]TDL31930.1 homocysteine S-methyltransferase [Jeotgalibacillus sp. S-D1]